MRKGCEVRLIKCSVSVATLPIIMVRRIIPIINALLNVVALPLSIILLPSIYFILYRNLESKLQKHSRK